MRLVNGFLVMTALVLTLSAKKGKMKEPKGTRWWYLANHGHRSNDLQSPVLKPHDNPNHLPLTKRQRKVVTRNPGSIPVIVAGLKMAIQECRHQFQERRWNCPVFLDGKGTSIFGKIVQKGCRETAFLYAITSAAVTHAIARGCSDGTVVTCSCSRELQARTGGNSWKWSGCSDNAKFGNKFSRQFVDVIEKGRDFRYSTNIHNNEAGRTHVTSALAKDCKCHGMSGSCTIKTCWMTLSPFRKVGKSLKDRFDGASRVLPDNTGADNISKNSNPTTKRRKKNRRRRFHFTPANKHHKKPNKRDLVYFERSPTFCDKDEVLGYAGTKDRECNATSLGIDGCDLLCCGRGYLTEQFQVKERCQCIFEWCCKVKCKTCVVEKIRHTCL